MNTVFVGIDVRVNTNQVLAILPDGTNLRQCPALQPFRPVVYTFHPKTVRGLLIQLPKTDRVDAWLIAERLRIDRPSAPGGLEDRYKTLRRCPPTRFNLVEELVREKQPLVNTLFLKLSSFVQDKPVRRTFGATALALAVETGCVETLAATSIEELIEQVVRYSRGKLPIRRP